MTLKSEIGRGQIYAGDTLLASTIAVEQTGPMQLTVRAGSFTTTGQSRLIPLTPQLHDLTETDPAHYELVYDTDDIARRARAWLTKPDGSFVEKSQAFMLAADAVFDLTSDPVDAKAYQAQLGHVGGVVDVLMRSRFTQDAYPNAPAGWQKIHGIIFEFIVPPGTVDLSGIDIFVLSVIAGFPPGTGAEDWLSQTGSV